jgi:Na+/melibiose symporter-like transporter
LAVLGLPTAALALAITLVSTYVPVVANDFLSSTTVIGGLIAIEGVMALWLPLVVGSWSDRLRTPIGGRLPFLVVATPFAAISLALMGFARSIEALAILVTVFFVAYFVAYEPYRALYPDLIDDDIAARAQSTQAVYRGAGTGVALVGGGLLIASGLPWPFLAGALVFSRGIGTALGPLLAGIAIEVLHGPFAGTDGYAAMWLVCGATILASVPFLEALRRRAGDRIDPPHGA